MSIESSPCSVHDFQPASNYDELFMHQRAAFAHNLKDMRDIRKKLYSAAEYFESQSRRADQDPLFIESLKEYVTQALISTVDHLGSVADKVNNSLDQNFKNLSEIELRFSCIKQRTRTCRDFVDHEGVSQQSLVIGTPKYYKHYLIPVSLMEFLRVLRKGMNISCIDAHFAEAVEATIVKSNSSFSRRPHFGLAFSEFPSTPTTFSFTTVPTNKQIGKRSTSPLRFPQKRLGSITSRSVSPSFPAKRTGSVANRSISPNSFISRHQFPLDRRDSNMLNIHHESERANDIQVYSQKTRSLFKALLGIDKSKKDGRMYR